MSVLAFTACNDDENEATLSTTQSLTLNLQGLKDLGTNYEYEGWMMVNGSPVSTGRFSVNAAGQFSTSTFVLNRSQLSSATAFILTIEPKLNDNPAPSEVHIMAGNFNGNNGSASVAHSAALGNDFSSAAGKYILATPTDGGSMDNEESGVWFLDNTSGSSIAGLNLPTLPAGWKYEGWVVFNNTPISTGTFTNVAAADSNAATSTFKGLINNGPAFPGEDFIQNAPTGITFPTTLKGKTLVVSIEPFPDNSPAPFLLKPLVNTIPQKHLYIPHYQ